LTVLRHILLLKLLIWALSVSCLGQTPQAFNGYISQNYSDIGSLLKRQSKLTQTLHNLQGSVKRLTQDAYDGQGRYINHERSEGESYTYLFDQDKNITQYWEYVGRDIPVIKEIYHDFKHQRPQYHMRFYALGKLDYSITYQYNNRGICIGRKTTSGMELQKERYEIQSAHDTMIVSSNAGEEYYHQGRLIAKSLYEQDQVIEYRYSDQGPLREWSLYHRGALSQVAELDEDGRIMERQSFVRRSTDTLVIDSHLVIYDYDQKGRLSTEQHRLSDPELDNYQVIYEYGDHDLLKRKTLTVNDNKRDLDYLYNEHGDCLNDASGYIKTTLVEVVYSNYDQHGNWLQRSVSDPEGNRRYVRRITYYNDNILHK